MRIGIIGGGIAGMTAAWLLQHEHHVTLLDRAPRLGGHVETKPIALGDKTVHAELGTRFFFDAAYPHFVALLRLLDVPIRWTDGTLSFTDVPSRRCVVLPPRSLRGAASLLRAPRLLKHVLSLRRLIEEQPVVAARRDFSITLREHLARGGYPASFGPELAHPLLAACWGAPLAEVPSFPVYSLLKVMPRGRRPGFYEVEGGMARYVRALGRELDRVDVRLGVGVRRVERRAGFVLDDETGGRHTFDQLILATSARDAEQLLRDVPSASEMRAAVGSIRHFDVEIALHGDASFMPRDRRDWAHNNVFFDGEAAWMSDWQGAREGVPVIRSWISKDRPLPEPLFERRSYHHVLMTPANAEVHRRIARLQGASGLWVTGMYALDVDSHESALLSALVPARALTPSSPNLRRLSRAAGELTRPLRSTRTTVAELATVEGESR